MQLAIRFVSYSGTNYSELFGCNRAYTFNCQTVINAIANAPELPERQQNKIFLMQVDKNELQLPTYNIPYEHALFVCL